MQWSFLAYEQTAENMSDQLHSEKPTFPIAKSSQLNKQHCWQLAMLVKSSTQSKEWITHKQGKDVSITMVNTTQCK